MPESGMEADMVAIGRVREQIDRVLRAWGMPEAPAGVTADLMAETDLLGIDSHGISMLPSYEDKLRAGTLRIDAQPRLVREGTASALLDGMGGLGHPVVAQAMRMAVDKAFEHGVGAVSVRNSHHFGAAGVYARLAVQRGAVALVTSSATTLIMVPTHGARPCWAPTRSHSARPPPTTTRCCSTWLPPPWPPTRSKVYDYYGKPLPPGWAVDGAGAGVTDSAAAMQFIFQRPEGGLTPLGGTAEMSSHKGYGLAIMAQVLAARWAAA